MSAVSSRRKGFKKGIDAEDARRKRETNIIELRKNKRDENLQKKRAVGLAGPGATAMEESNRGGAAFQRKVRRQARRVRAAFCFVVWVIPLG